MIRKGSRALMIGALALVVAVATGSAARADGGGVAFEGRTSEAKNAFLLNARDGHAQQQAHEALKGRPEYELKRYQRAPMCNVSGPYLTTPLNGECPPADGSTGPMNCGEDTTLDPLWMQERADENSPWSEWRPVDYGGCGADILPVLTVEDFRRLPLPAPALTLQPDRGWVLVNIETIVRTDPTPVTLRTDLLGVGMTVEATPTFWTYDFGDGHTLSTRSPGHPYPDHDTFHEYEWPNPERTITLTAEWTGRYQVDGSPVWRDIDGVALTTTTSAPFRVEERTSRLVDNLCTDRPKPPDC